MLSSLIAKASIVNYAADDLQPRSSETSDYDENSILFEPASTISYPEIEAPSANVSKKITTGLDTLALLNESAIVSLLFAIFVDFNVKSGSASPAWDNFITDNPYRTSVTFLAILALFVEMIKCQLQDKSELSRQISSVVALVQMGLTVKFWDGELMTWAFLTGFCLLLTALSLHHFVKSVQYVF